MRNRNRRGAATVELAVATIVLIPTILYAMFLEDLLYYKFDQQEAVTSTSWDFLNQDFRKLPKYSGPGPYAPSSAGGSPMWEAVVHSAKRTYADHTSAWNTYGDPLTDADDLAHHQAVAAHQCWLAQGGHQVWCGFDFAPGMTIEPTFNFKNRGGVAYCTGKLGVQNYFLSEKILGRYGKKTKEDSLGSKLSDMHTNADIHSEAAGDSYLYPEMTFGVMHDTWALYKTDTINPVPHPRDLLNEFSSWVRIPYGLRAGNLSDANKFADDAINADILDTQAKFDGLGDTLITPPLAWRPEYDRKFGPHTASGYSDPRHEGTYQALEKGYLGRPPNKQW